MCDPLAMVKLMTNRVTNILRLSILLALGSLVNCQTQQLCRYDLDEIEDSLNKFGNINSFTVNCLTHNGTYAESISISVFYNNEGSGDDNINMRYDFQCVGGTTLIRTPSDHVSNESNLACTSCNFTAANPCEASEYVCLDVCTCVYRHGFYYTLRMP